MRIPAKALCLAGWLIMSPSLAGEPDMEFFLFLADFTDEKGDWDAPELDEKSTQSEEAGVEE